MYLSSGRLAVPASVEDSTAGLCANDAFFWGTYTYAHAHAHEHTHFLSLYLESPWRESLRPIVDQESLSLSLPRWVRACTCGAGG